MTFEFAELSDFTKDVIRIAETEFPKELKSFLKGEANKQKKIMVKKAKSEVGTSKGSKKDWIPDKSYHRKIKSGKVYKYDGNDCVRAFNSSPHGHLIENGHRMVTKDGREVGFVQGKHIVKKSSEDFKDEFAKDVEDFAENILNRGLING